MYNYPGQYGPPPGYAGYPGSALPPGVHNPAATTAGAPGMGMPPGMPPGMAPPPGMMQQPPHMTANLSLPFKPAPGMPVAFQPPPNMVHINFNAPVIRLGAPAPAPINAMHANVGGHRNSMDMQPQQQSHHPQQQTPQIQQRRGAGVGADGGASSNNPRMPRDNLLPPTREEVFRTIFIGKIPKSMTDHEVTKVLRAAGSLRKWTRAYDGDSKPCTFGFAEFENAESLETAIEILPGVEVPATKAEIPREDKAASTENGELAGDADAKKEIEKTRLLISVDDASRNYAEEWKEKRAEDESAAQFRIDTARENVANVLASLFNPLDSNFDGDGDATMLDALNSLEANGEVITIPIAPVEDELADIPPELKETVTAEISSFRDRANRRELERLRREEEAEAAERKSRAGPAVVPTPTGPSGARINGIPLGPRGAPSGPRDHSNNSPTRTDTASNRNNLNFMDNDEEDDTDASGEELERRRQAKKQAIEDKAYQNYERRWGNREKSRAAAIEREKVRDGDDASHMARKREAAAKYFREFDDDSELTRRGEEYYRDKNSWLRSRAMFRAREKEFDERDRMIEERESERARQQADSFLDRQAEELSARAQLQAPQQQQGRLKISLGAAAAQRVQASAPRRSVAEVEGLLEDEEEVDRTARRILVPINVDASAGGQGPTEEERQSAVRQLAGEIPTDKEGLWAWQIQWDFVDEAVVREQIRPFVEKKMLEYLGVQEEMLVDAVEEHIKKNGSAEDLVGELEGPLDEEAEVFVKKLWRMLIFCSESEKRGLSG